MAAGTNNEQGGTATIEQAEKQPGVERYIKDALRTHEKVNVGDLTDEQRARAIDAAKTKPSLKGKAVATFVMTGEDLKAQVKHDNDDKTVKAAAEAKANRSAAAKASGSTPPRSSSKYSDEIKDGVRRAEALRNQGDKTYNASPRAHQAIRETVIKQLGTKTPSKAEIVKISGAGSLKELTAIAKGEGTRSDIRKLSALEDLVEKHPDMKQVGSTRNTRFRGRQLAAALVAWTEQL